VQHVKEVPHTRVNVERVILNLSLIPQGASR
jgi:hypothetical protein